MLNHHNSTNYLTLNGELTSQQPKIVGQFVMGGDYDAFTTFVKLRSSCPSEYLKQSKMQ